MIELSGKTVLVTGASSGIGSATALAFAKFGCRVGVAARRLENLEALAAKLGGEKSLAVRCDVRDPKEAREAVEAVCARWGRIDILVNNAGITDTKFFDEQDLDSVENIVRTNLLGAIYATHAALQRMRREGRGHIVNVASVGGLMGLPWQSVYSATKFGLVGFTESLRKELYGSGITFTSFCPGAVDTPMVADAFADPRLKKQVAPKTPEEVADKIVWAVMREAPEVVYGEAPGFLFHLLRLFPAVSDWVLHRVFSNLDPRVRAAVEARKR